jgi:hypothetical protein
MHLRLIEVDAPPEGTQIHSEDRLALASILSQPGDIVFTCGRCEEIVAHNPPLPGVRRRVFHCKSCGAFSVIPKRPRIVR